MGRCLPHLPSMSPLLQRALPPLPSRLTAMDDASLPAPPVPAQAPAPAPAQPAAPRVPFHCSECGKSFRYRSDLRRHFARHTALKPHACPRCGKGFKHSFNLANHLRSHTGERPYRCSACPKGFRDSTGLLHHQVSPADLAGRPPSLPPGSERPAGQSEHEGFLCPSPPPYGLEANTHPTCDPIGSSSHPPL